MTVVPSSSFPVPPPPPPVSPYGTLTGQLFLYAGCRAAFESPTLSLSSTQQQQMATNKCVLLGGLSDGLLPVPYVAKLEQALARIGGGDDTNNENRWSLVQPILSGSYLGFGHGSLDRDTSELDELFSYLSAHRNAAECGRFCLVGHSTGCQNIVHYLKNGDPRWVRRVAAAVLQAPVSDREHAAFEDPDAYRRNLELARSMQERAAQNVGNNSEEISEEMMPRSAFWAPITASRYLDLHERGGADDYFSSDFDGDELKELLRHVGCESCDYDGDRRQHKRKILVVFSGSDEFVPTNVDSELLTKRLVDAMNADCDNGGGGNDNDPSMLPARGLFLPLSNHNLSSNETEQSRFVQAIADVLVEQQS